MSNNKLISWDSVLDTTMKIPGIAVNRNDFLKSAFQAPDDRLSVNRPIDCYSKEQIEKVAKDVINSHTLKVTSLSTVAGLPGGFAMIGTIPADITQFYYHAIVLSQKLGYIYGWPDLLNADGTISEGARNVITVWIGVMLGAQTAAKTLAQITVKVGEQVALRLPRQALTKTVWYPILKQIGKWLGIQVTKQSAGKALGKLIPLIGGPISGGITFATFRPMASKLQNELRDEMYLFKSPDKHFYFDNEDVEQEFVDMDFEELCILTCINVAKVDFEFTEDEQNFLMQMIDSSSLSEEKKGELLLKLHEKELTDIDFSQLSLSEVEAISLIENVLAVIQIDGIMKTAEKVYLFKIAKDLGISKEDLDDMILASKGVC